MPWSAGILWKAGIAKRAGGSWFCPATESRAGALCCGAGPAAGVSTGVFRGRCHPDPPCPSRIRAVNASRAAHPRLLLPSPPSSGPGHGWRPRAGSRHAALLSAHPAVTARRAPSGSCSLPRSITSLPRLLHASLFFPFFIQLPFRYLYSVTMFPLRHHLSRLYKLNSLSLCP